KKITTEYPDGRATIQICGRMNSADPAGGYQGFRDFYGFIEKGRFRLSGIAPLADPRIYRDICKG
ncbi:MAG TPA: hypothetical protein VLA51_06625, partial [Paracoccaceae bacterium]|nr:hypothetical protein [Paracoccaceae bacterium]